MRFVTNGGGGQLNGCYNRRDQMRAIAWLLRAFCCLFHAILSLVLIALGVVASASHVQDMKLEILPWEGAKLNHMLIILGIVGLVCVILAMTTRVLQFPIELWSIYVVAMLIRGIFMSPNVTFQGQEDFHNWLWLLGGAVLALIGSMLRPWRRRGQ